MNSCFKEPVIALARDGKFGGSTRLTPAGLRILRLYERMQAESIRPCDVLCRELMNELRPKG